MGISKESKNQISELLKTKIKAKLKDYKPETNSMPFHFRLLGKDKMALYSFIHSVNTMLGQSIFESIAEIIAEPNFDTAKAQYTLTGSLSDESYLAIGHLMDDLKSTAKAANVENENKALKTIVNKDSKERKERVDLFLKKNNIEWYFEIKTVKPNIDVFARTKEKLLRWKAMRYADNKNIEVKTCICIPYNPEAPKPYARWTLQGLYDLKKEVLVAEEFWDMLGGKGTYDELLDIFEKTGLELKEVIDKKMAEF